ncbi:hypothetical protein HYN59_11660 [Flavobacterium album]|uniref:Uncharacterized protein n=1 Tax=Flavobacterium album TaxID=2175091 RepID=A0A2S1QZ73_9FLAO|nr:hypothetical protein [Flavobacterium album]AWH85723.1 hypothetical protein HYN59_11660 [Flavobacterium album]
MKYFILVLIMFASCTKKGNAGNMSISNNSKDSLIQRSFQDGQADISLQKIPYSTKDYYKDSLAQKIVPYKQYDYWAYIGVRDGHSGYRHNIIYQHGDTLLKKTHNIKLANDDKGFFPGCHPHWCVDYIAAIKDHKTIFITSEHDLKSFIGTINNLEEAMLIAKMNGYNIDYDTRGCSYKLTDKGFEVHLVKYTEYPLQKEFFKVTINQKGTITVDPTGIVIKGRDALK